MTSFEQKEQETKEWASKRFGIPLKQILWYNSGICYDRIGVTTKTAANKVTNFVKGQSVNGGMFDGMPLGGQTYYSREKNNAIKRNYYDVMC